GRRRRRLWVAGAALVVVLALVAGLLLWRAEDPRTASWAPVGPPVPVGTAPVDVELGEGAVWVASEDGSLTRVDPETLVASRIDVGGEPAQVVVAEGAAWVRSRTAVTRVDAATGAVAAPVPTPEPSNGLAVADGVLWLTHSAANTVSRIDARSLQPVGDPIPVGRAPRNVVVTGGSAYVGNRGDGTLTRIDARTGRITGTLLVGQALGGFEVDSGLLYVAADGGIVSVRLDTFEWAPRYDPAGWSWFQVGDGLLWIVHDEGDQAVRRYDLGSPAPLVESGPAVPGFGENVVVARLAAEALWIAEQDRLLKIAPD
ncbi:YncE family protein, partial [Pseudonocardia pini]|uniref:YncE family protein n=1 Tax=Pseudonocardia pini TaxID=2758030 RepID=UPI001C68F1CB